MGIRHIYRKLSTSSGPAEAQPTPVVAATAVVVWDQYNNAGTAVTLSATFTDSAAMNSDLADDFDVEGYAWIVRWIDVDGAYFNGPGPANSFTVYFYADNDGFPATRSTPVSRRGSRTVARSGYMYAIVLLARASRSYFPANIGSRSKPT